MSRLFLALEIPDPILDRIIEQRNELAGEYHYRWEKREKLHITLKFIGDFDEDNLTALQERISIIREYEPFQCAFTEFGFFFRQRQPVILWAGMKVPDSMSTLAGRLNKELEPLGIPMEKRSFKPHLTIMRIKKHDKGKRLVQAFEGRAIKAEPFSADSIILFRSTLRPEGSVYTPIAKYRLEAT